MKFYYLHAVHDITLPQRPNSTPVWLTALRPCLPVSICPKTNIQFFRLRLIRAAYVLPARRRPFLTPLDRLRNQIAAHADYNFTQPTSLDHSSRIYQERRFATRAVGFSEYLPEQ